MDRRGFLKGVFGGVTAAGLVVAASPDEIRAFTQPLASHAPLMLAPVPKQQGIDLGEHLYNAKGELVAVVTAVNIYHDRLDVTSASDQGARFISGLMHVDIRAHGLGPVEWDAAKKRPTLRGQRR